MLMICLVFCKSEPQYAYKRYAYKENMYDFFRQSRPQIADSNQNVQILAFRHQRGFPDPTNTVL